MRTRERLIALLDSVNRNAPGVGRTEALELWAASALLARAVPISAGRFLLAAGWVRHISETHTSPHIRGLAAEALHYLNEDAARV